MVPTVTNTKQQYFEMVGIRRANQRLFLFASAMKYKNIETWPDHKTTTSQLGHVGGIALNSGDKELVVFHRGTRRWESQ